MSLPPGFLDELRTRTSLTQVVGRKVMWDSRKSNQGKGDMWAPCPFHQEKSASFHVDDRKGFYYCFGCHAKGDAISFIRETENVGFMEAIEILAGEAGMTMPAPDPLAREKADRRTQLTDVMEAAVRFFRMSLASGAGTAARNYLQTRQLSAQSLDRFDIGFAPDARQALWQHLIDKGTAPQDILDAGLAAKPDDGGMPYDRFRGRIIYPIRDPRGRCIAFGGRAMSENVRAKYLNSPETELFDKGRSLYHHGPAREAAGKGAPLVVVEGYMDVIALAEAGFGATVAPLGTAVTETQLKLLWRISQEPLIALDGDRAGVQAAMRIADLALPIMEAGQSLRFCMMPANKDPDDVVKSGGPAAFQALLDKAKPMVQLLWQRETEGQNFDSPERRAALDKSLRELSGRIADPTLRHHYTEEFKSLQWQLSRQNRRVFRPGGGAVPGAASPGARRSPLAATDSAMVEETMREAVILATLVQTPAALENFEDRLVGLQMIGNGHARLLNALQVWQRNPVGDLKAYLSEKLGDHALETLFQDAHVALTPAVRQPGNQKLANLCLAEELAKLATRRGLEAEIREASEDPAGFADERITWRLSQASEARNKADRQDQEDQTEYDTSPNGAKLNKDERDLFDQLISGINYSRPRRN